MTSQSASRPSRSPRLVRRRAVSAFLATGLFDREWYEAQSGATYGGRREAAAHYLADGAARHSPHPLVDLLSLPAPVRGALAEGDVGPLVDRLRASPGNRPFGPLFDARRFDHDESARAAHPGGALGLWLETHGADGPLPGAARTTLAEARQAVIDHARRVRSANSGEAAGLDWAEVTAELAQRVAGRVSVVLPTYQDGVMTSRAVHAVLRNSGDADVEVVVVDNGSDPAVGCHLAASFVAESRVRYERMPRNLNFALGSNVGFTRSTGDHVVFLNNDTEVHPGWLPPLLRALEDPGVLGAQPLLLYPDDSIQTAGTVFPSPGTLPCHFLVGHPPEDAVRLGEQRYHVVTAAALAMRSGDVAALQGFDPVFVNGMEDVDLCLRAGELRPGRFVVTPASRVTHHEGKTPGRGAHIPQNRARFMERWRGRLPEPEAHRWESAGFRLAHVYGDGQPIPSPRPVVVRERTGPGLRWGIKLPSVGGEKGDRWGDTHFAESLGVALERLGQEVVTYRHGAHANPAAALDDVVLGIRGLDVIGPVPGKVNLLWVISHPDDVDPAELGGFDRVFAASAPWAAVMTERSGRPVEVLLQATDLRRRADLTVPAGDGTEPVFVGGTTPTRDRTVVLDAIQAGVRVQVHGPNWTKKIPQRNLVSTYVPNDRLMDLYRRHGLVLADHHGDMAVHGFLANRLFDAVASGARVVSDPVPGLEIFQGAVQAYTSLEDLASLCRPEGRDRFPDDEEMARIAAAIAADHSFDHRAAELLAAARESRGA